MKKIILMTWTTLFFSVGFSQTNFQWEKIDSVQKTKAQVYSDNKMFIAEKMGKNNGLDNKAYTKTVVLDALVGGNSRQTYDRSTPDRIVQTVIMNDDKETGTIVVKDAFEQTLFYQLNSHIWIFSYNVTFYCKDIDSLNSKFKIVINNVHCSKAWCASYEWPRIDCSDIYPGWKNTSLNEKRYFQLMSALKTELQSIIDSYVIYIKGPSASNSNW